MKRLAAELAKGTPHDLEEQAKRAETFKEAADRIVDGSKIASKTDRKARLRIHVFPHIGRMPVTDVRPSDVREILIGIAEQGLSKDLVVHVRNDIGAVLGRLWRDEALPENVVARVEIPDAFVDTRERAVLTDDELLTYLAWTHPEERFQLSTLERQTMACLSRMFG